jgi:hypothetical protein
MGRYDGEGGFPSLDRRLFAGGTPGDVHASAALRGQEYWLAHQAQVVGTPPPRGDREHYASYEWRALWHTWLDLRPGVRRVTYQHAYVSDYDGANDPAPEIEMRMILHGFGESTGVLAPYSDGVAEFVIDLGEPLARAPGDVLLSFEFRSNVADVEKLVSDYPGVNPDPDADQTLAQWTTKGGVLFRRIDGGAQTAPLPTNASHVLVSMERDEDDVLRATDVIEVHGPNQSGSSLRYVYPACRLGAGEEIRLGMGYLSYFEWEGGELQIDYEPVGSSPTFISYPLSVMKPQGSFRGQDISIHGHNATGLYARNPQLRAFGLPGAQDGSGEQIDQTRWSTLRVLQLGVQLVGEMRQVVNLNRATPLLSMRYTRSAFFLQNSNPPITQQASLRQSMTVTLTATQHRDGDTAPTVIGSASRDERMDFLSPQFTEADEFSYGLGRQFKPSLPGVSGIHPTAQWRGGLAKLDDLLASVTPNQLTVELTGHDPDYPVILTLTYEFDDAPQLTDNADAYVIITSQSAHTQGLPFDEGAPSFEDKRIISKYQGFAPRETAIGQGVDTEDWSPWHELNHRTWSQVGWTGEGIGPVFVTLDTFHQPDELARWFMLCDVQRELGADTWRVRLAAFVKEVEVRITITDLPAFTTTTALMTPAGISPQWVEHEFTFTDDGQRRITLEVRTTGDDGFLYCVAPRESRAIESDL